MSTTPLTKEIAKSAREYSGLKENFDLEEETYYTRQSVEKYNAYIAGANSVFEDIVIKSSIIHQLN